MKERIKRLFASIAAILMAIAMIGANAVPVKAAGNGYIAISNPTVGKTYYAYKVFDATYSGTASDKKISYTYSGNNANFLSALRGTTSPFTVTQLNATTVSVIKKNDATEEQIVNFLKQNGPTYNENTQQWFGGYFGDSVASGTGREGARQVRLNKLDYGYYFVTTTTGSAVTIDNVTPNVTVLDKNQSISHPDKQEQTETNTDWKYQGTTDESPVPTGSVGSTVNYKVTGSFTEYVGTTAVTNLVFTDTMSDGLSADQNVIVKINGQTLTTYNQTKNGETQPTKIGTDPQTEYTITYGKNADSTWTTTITIPTVRENGEFIYGPNSTYEITYSAKVNKDAVQVDPEQNTVDLKYNNNVDVGSDITKVAHYNLTLTKYDGKNTSTTGDDTVLAGAKFQLYKEGSDTPLNVVLMRGDAYGTGESNSSNNSYRLAEAGETSNETTTVINEMTTGTDGVIKVLGLSNGTYYFKETQAPDGFNKIAGQTENAVITNKDASLSVINNAGPTLPSTGGIGTTIFYIVGGVLIIGAAVLLIARRKRNA